MQINKKFRNIVVFFLVSSLVLSYFAIESPVMEENNSEEAVSFNLNQDSNVYYKNEDMINLDNLDSPLKISSISNITILSPHVNQYCGIEPPNFTVFINFSNVHARWYTLDGGAINISFTTNGTLDDIEWKKYSDGDTPTISFYCNDTNGNIYSDSVNIIIDKRNPWVRINYLVDGTEYKQAPNYGCSLSGELAVYWWEITDGINTVSTTINGEWYDFKNGVINYTIFVKDRANNLVFDKVSIIKNVPPPDIVVVGEDDDENDSVDDEDPRSRRIDDIRVIVIASTLAISGIVAALIIMLIKKKRLKIYI